MDAATELLQLMARVKNRDRAAFALLYDRTATKLFGVTMRILSQRDLAEDALQECFVTVWERAGDYDAAKGSVMSWLITIARHRAIDLLRRRAHRNTGRLYDEDALLAIAAGTVDRADRGAELDAVWRCLKEIDAEPRRAVLLAYAYGLTHEELARRLATPIGTIKSWIRRSLERLKRCLDG
jgi:RNA polymerase sigma-70 factor, ECF subfamily